MPAVDVGTGPLAGLKVLELGSFIAGPFAGQLLGDHGAEVLKVESPGVGDPMRRWGVMRDGESLWWPAIARNKRSVAVDLRTDRGRDVVRRLASACDVVIENFRPGRLEEWGLDYATLAALNPAVIVVHVSGFGQTGPRADEAGFGSIGEAVGGIRFTTGDPDRRPARTGISLGDSLAALFAVVGTLAAVQERNRSGLGQEVDVAIYEAVAALMESTIVDYDVAGVLRCRTGSVLPGVAPSNIYLCADGSEIVIAANADAVFRRLCSAIGRPELADDPRYRDHASRGENMVELDGEIEAWSRSRGPEEALEALERFGVPAGKVFSARDMLADPHYAAREMILRPLVDGAGSTISMAGIVPKYSRTPGAVRTTGPRLGEHTREVLERYAGVGEGEWNELLELGLVEAPPQPAPRALAGEGSR